MTVCYKLTNQQWETRGPTKWGPSITHEVSGTGDLCGPGWLHCYDSAELAALLNPIHANLSDPVLWQAEYSGSTQDDRGLKRGVQRLTTVDVISLPAYTTTQRVVFAILCVRGVYKNPKWVAWADAWLSGADRSARAAAAAAADAANAANAAAAAADAANAANAAALDLQAHAVTALSYK